MAENKKHHYVPRFYLRRFSSDGRSINLYNLLSSKTILRANLRNQCYRPYFYGEDSEVEHALATVEAEAAGLFRLVDQYGYLPRPWSAGHLTLVLHILIQYARTTYAAETLNEINDKMIKHLLGPKAEAEGFDLSKVMIGVKHPARYSLGMSMKVYPLLLDLRYKLLVNRTNQEFITSDNPVVLYNQFFSFRAFGSNCGLASKGLQIFFPLDYEKMVLMYDADVYSVGTASREVIDITIPQDVYNLNTLQMCSAESNIYFRATNINLRALHKKASPFLRKRKANFDVYPQESTQKGRRELVATSKEDIRTNLSLSFLGIRRSARRWRESFRKMMRQPAVVVRDQQMCADYEEFQKQVESGHYKHGDFLVFLDKKYGERANNSPEEEGEKSNIH